MNTNTKKKKNDKLKIKIFTKITVNELFFEVILFPVQEFTVEGYMARGSSVSAPPWRMYTATAPSTSTLIKCGRMPC